MLTGDVYKNTEMVVKGGSKAELLVTKPDGTTETSLIHDFKGDGIIQGMHNLDSSISSFARACFNYALDLSILINITVSMSCNSDWLFPCWNIWCNTLNNNRYGIIQGMHNLDSSISSFARACFNYALDLKQDIWFATKDTISKEV